MRNLRLACVRVALALAFVSTAAAATFVDADRTVEIDAKRGVDKGVRYSTLLALGPWDDRNYQLTKEDLALLSPRESEAHELIPVFYRVKMRRGWPDLPKSGPVQYPRHAFPMFRNEFGGYLVDGKLYGDVRRVGERLVVVVSDRSAAAAEEGREKSETSATGEARITSPIGAAESAIKMRPGDPSRVIAGTYGPGPDQKMHYSTDGGATWTQTTLPLGGLTGDPTVDWSSDGTYAYAATLGTCWCIWFYRSNDLGVTWNGLESTTPGDPRREITMGGSDKEYLHVDKHHASPYKDRIYLTWHDSNVLKFAMSSDLGNTFTTQSFSSSTAERGIGSDIATGPDGAVYYVWAAYNSRTIRLRKSTNGGVTFGSSIVAGTTIASYAFPVPSMDRREVFVYPAIDADLGDGPYGGSVYVTWTDSTAPTVGNPALNHGRIQVAYSRDGGATWTPTTPHEIADASTVDRWHPWIAVGPDGTVHVVFYDTRLHADRASVDLYHSFSTDGAQTWSTPERVTSASSPPINDSFEFGDYNGLDRVLDSVIAIFTDNRDETGGTAQSVDVYSAGMSSAPAGAGAVPDGAFVPGPQMIVGKSGADLDLSWGTACGPATDYAVYEGELPAPGVLTQRLCSTAGATTAVLTPSDDSRYYLVVPLSTGKEGSYGRSSDGSERAPAAAACAPQLVASCP